MAKKLAYKSLTYASAGVMASAVLLFFILGVTGVISTLCAVLVVCSLIGVALVVVLNLLNKRAIKKEKEQKLKAELIARNARLKALYDILKIPYQYAEDGHIKDIFELLKIKPVFNENGKREPLVYELLGIMPKFDKNINERPTVFAIKNRVKRVAKGITSPLVLTYKPKLKTNEGEKQTGEGKKEEKNPKKDVKTQAKEVAKKPEAKAKPSGENKGQQGIIVKIKTGASKPIKIETNTLDRKGAAGFNIYRAAKDPSVQAALKAGEFSNKKPEPAATNAGQSASEHNKGGANGVDLEDNFEDKNLYTTKMSYIFDEEEMEK